MGDIHYTLAKSDMEEDTTMFGCRDGCVYQADEFPVDRFCFKDGDLPVTCLDGENVVEWSNLSVNITLGGDQEFHWCYDGDCGPERWGDHFEVQIRIL